MYLHNKSLLNVLYLSPLPLLLFLLLDAGGWILQYFSSCSLTVLRPCCSWSDFYVDSCFSGGHQKVLCIEMYKSACSFPCSCWVLLVGFSKLAACVIQYSFNLSSWAWSSCTLVVPLNSPVELWLRACRLPEVFSALGMLAIHFLSYAPLLIQKLWLSTWEGGLHLVITAGKWNLWWETRFGVPGLRMMLKTFRCIHSGDLPHIILLVPERPDVLSTGLYAKKWFILRSTMMSCISTLCHESHPTSS